MRIAPKRLIACLFFAGPAPLASIAEAALAFTPQVAVRPKEAIFLDLTASWRLLENRNLAQELREMCGVFAAVPRIAFAQTPQAALALARYQRRTVDDLPLTALGDFLNPFVVDEEAAQNTALLIHRLEKLGLKTVGDYWSAPMSRLGTVVARNTAFAWPRFVLPEELSEKIDFDLWAENAGVHHLDGLRFILKSLCDRLFARLAARQKTLLSVELRFTLEDLSRRQWQIELPVAQRTTTGLLPILTEKLQTDLERHPLTCVIAKIKLTALLLGPGGTKQRDFFDARHEIAEQYDALLGRLTAQLGEEAAFFARPVDRYLPEKAWEKTLEKIEDKKVIPPIRVPRPTRLLEQPIALSGEDLRLRNAQWAGPERLEGEWWLDEKLMGFARDYYEVETAEGLKLWIFRTPDRHLFLHGYFD